MRERARSGDALDTLQRLHELELQQARVEREAAVAAVERDQQRVDQLLGDIEQLHALGLTQVTSGNGVSAQTLRELQTYLRLQNDTLDEQQTVLEESRERAEHARTEVVSRFERLSVIERLRARRARDARTEEARSEQKRLDDQGLIVESRRIIEERSEQELPWRSTRLE